MLLVSLVLNISGGAWRVEGRSSIFSSAVHKYVKPSFAISGVQCSAEVSLLFAGELNPVATKAQKKVPVPEG